MPLELGMKMGTSINYSESIKAALGAGLVTDSRTVVLALRDVQEPETESVSLNGDDSIGGEGLTD